MKDELIYEYAPRSIGKGYSTDHGRIERVVETQVLDHMMKEVTACNKAKGWHDLNPRVEQFFQAFRDGFECEMDDQLMLMVEQFFGPRTFGDDIALLHSEVSEMLEAYRITGDANDQTGPAKEVGGTGKPEGVGAEAADVLVRLLDTCDRYGIDLFSEWRRKVDYNWTRPQRHGNKAL